MMSEMKRLERITADLEQRIEILESELVALKTSHDNKEDAIRRCLSTFSRQIGRKMDRDEPPAGYRNESSDWRNLAAKHLQKLKKEKR